MSPDPRTRSESVMVDGARLVDARTRITDALGGDAVLTAPERIIEFHDPFEGSEATRFQPSFVVQPADVDELRTVVSIVNDLELPVWTSSQGRNFGYGGSAPVINGSIVINLRRLNRILEIDEEAGYALIEPGVTFFDLYEELRRRDAKLWMSVPDLGWGSVIGNALEHGYGYGELGDHASAVCGMEVLLASGELIRTGQGGNPDSTLWQCHRRGFGPSLDGLFMQSNFGIVTKLGIWLSPRPEKFVTGSIICDGEDDIATLVDTLRPLVRDNTIQGMPLVSSTPRADSDAGSSPSRHAEQSRRLRSVMRPGRWNARVSFYGPAQMVTARIALVENAIATALPDARLELREYRGTDGPDDIDPRDQVPAGIPTMVLLELLHEAFGTALGHLDFSPVIPFDGAAAAQHERMVREVMREFDLTGPFAWIVNSRSLVGACMLLFDVTDSDQVSAAHAAVRRMCDRAATEFGWNEYRAHPALVEHVAASFRFGDGALHRTYTKIKDALDPRGILSPGNHGIWPSDR